MSTNRIIHKTQEYGWGNKTGLLINGEKTHVFKASRRTVMGNQLANDVQKCAGNTRTHDERTTRRTDYKYWTLQVSGSFAKTTQSGKATMVLITQTKHQVHNSTRAVLEYLASQTFFFPFCYYGKSAIIESSAPHRILRLYTYFRPMARQ